MKLVILGSGTSVPHSTRSSSGFWLETAGGTLLLDCSASVGHRMAQESLDWANLDAVWISHFHLDHCGGLAPLLFGMRNAKATQDRSKPLRIFGADGLKDLLKAFDDAGKYKLFDQKFPVEIIEIEQLETFEILPGIDAVAMRTPHTQNSHAIHLTETGGTTFVYTSDTGYEIKLATFARRADLLLMECSFVKEKPTEKHLELAEANELIRRAEPKVTVLTHLYPEWDLVEFDEEVAKFSPGFEVIEATDGLRLVISE
ncbi:MAG TPA: MBL fold metallo-hydrolase [Pyrinomonadaceae bacterium]|nr:MBL fold metallo-hydrolase [Pyrinomonadaceae bacterium]